MPIMKSLSFTVQKVLLRLKFLATEEHRQTKQKLDEPKLHLAEGGGS